MKKYADLLSSQQQNFQQAFLATVPAQFQNLVQGMIIQSGGDIFNICPERIENTRHDFNCKGFAFHADLNNFYDEFSDDILARVIAEANFQGFELDDYLSLVGVLDSHHPYASCLRIARHLTYEAVVLTGLYAHAYMQASR